MSEIDELNATVTEIERKLAKEMHDILLEAFVERGKDGGACTCHLCEAGVILGTSPELLDKAMERVSLKHIYLLAKTVGVEDGVRNIMLVYGSVLAAYICGWMESIEDEEAGHV